MLALNMMINSKKTCLHPEYYRKPAQHRSLCEQQCVQAKSSHLHR